jgi:hypothetical protein
MCRSRFNVLFYEAIRFYKPETSIGPCEKDCFAMIEIGQQRDVNQCVDGEH